MCIATLANILKSNKHLEPFPKLAGESVFLISHHTASQYSVQFLRLHSQRIWPYNLVIKNTAGIQFKNSPHMGFVCTCKCCQASVTSYQQEGHILCALLAWFGDLGRDFFFGCFWFSFCSFVFLGMETFCELIHYSFVLQFSIYATQTMHYTLP